MWTGIQRLVWIPPVALGSAVQWLISVPRTLLGSCGMSETNCKRIERFSYEYLKVIGFTLLRYTIGPKKLALLFFHDMQSEIKQKPTVPRSHAFSRAWRQPHVFICA